MSLNIGSLRAVPLYKDRTKDQRILCEVHYLRKGALIKKLYLGRDKGGYFIFEEELKPDRYKPLGIGVWEVSYFHPYDQMHMARTAFLGRQAICAYENGNQNGGE